MKPTTSILVSVLAPACLIIPSWADVAKAPASRPPRAEPVEETGPTASRLPDFEPPVVLSAFDVLESDVRVGPVHRVRDRVPTDGYMAHFTIDSDYGTFECIGVDQVRTRVREIYAIQKLTEVSKSDLFADGLRRSIEQPVDAVKNIVKDPVGTVKAAPKTVGHFFKKIGRSIETSAAGIKQRAEDRDPSDDDSVAETAKEVGTGIGRTAKGIIGFDSARLACAKQLGVDPYSDNPRLQEEMEKVAWVFFAGGLPIRIGASVASAGASTALTGVKAVGLPEEVYTLTPSEINFRTQEGLAAMGVPEETRQRFATNPTLSISLQQSIFASLTALNPAAGRPAIAELAAQCSTRRQAEFLDQSLRLLARRQQNGSSRFTELIVSGRLLAAVDTKGTLLVPAPVDLISWTEDVADFSRRDDLASRRRVLLLAGKTTQRAGDALAAAGWTVTAP